MRLVCRIFRFVVILALPLLGLFLAILWAASALSPSSGRLDLKFTAFSANFSLGSSRVGVDVQFQIPSVLKILPTIIPGPEGTVRTPPDLKFTYPPPVFRSASFLGFRYRYSAAIDTIHSTATESLADCMTSRALGVPYWSCLPFLLPLLLFLRRSRRPAPGFCSTCGYDLRAHHPGEKCPECGTVIPEKKPA
jgi:hypothetical protein